MVSKTLRETIENAYDEACNYYQLFKDESDRGAAVLAVARFKEQLKEAIKSSDAAFRPSGLNFWVSIEIAYALGLYDQETRDGLHTVRKIRNKFVGPLKRSAGIRTRGGSGPVSATQGRLQARQFTRKVSDLLADS